jgi:hypothetical protein
MVDPRPHLGEVLERGPVAAKLPGAFHQVICDKTDDIHVPPLVAVDPAPVDDPRRDSGPRPCDA